MDARTRGDIHEARGTDFERRSLIYYFLLRWADYPGATAILSDAEDATIIYPDATGGAVVEDIQCKKLEEPKPESDEWWSRELPISKFVEWMTSPRGGVPAVGRLAANSELFLTLLVFAEPSKPVRKFLAPGASAPALMRLPLGHSPFAPNYRHLTDPDPTNRLRRSEAALKIRIVPLCPYVLQMRSEEILHARYGIASSQLTDAYYSLEHLVGARKKALQREDRKILLSDVENELTRFRIGRAGWRAIREMVDGEEARPATAIRPPFPVVTWADFKNGHYIQTESLSSAAEALRSHSLLVLCGYTGSGKTTLCRFLAHGHLQASALAQCFYLQVKPGDALQAELEFFSANLQQPFLFIIDDEHFSKEAVRDFAFKYLHARVHAPVRARLIVATTETYSNLRLHGRNEPLDNGHPIKFEFLPAELMEAYLGEFQRYRGLDLKGIRSEIANLSRGRLGVALLLADNLRASEFLTSQPVAMRKANGAITSWLAASLQLDRSAVMTEITPALWLFSWGLRLNADFYPTMHRLASAGIVDVLLLDGSGHYQLRAEYSVLGHRAWHHDGDRITLLKRYAERHPGHVGRMACALAADEAGKGLLHGLVQEHVHIFTPKAPDDLVIDLEDLTLLIASALRAGRGIASRLLQSLFVPGSPAALALRLTVDNLEAGDVRRFTRFLNAVHDADRDFARHFWRSLPASSARHSRLLTLVCLATVPFEDGVRLLKALKRCESTFALAIARDFTQTNSYETKWDGIRSDGPGRVIGALRELADLSRRLFMAARDRFLSGDFSSGWHRNAHDLSYFAYCLSQMRRLAPREANRALATLRERHSHALLGHVQASESLTESISFINSVSRVHRRTAVELARDASAALEEHIRNEVRFNNVTSALTTLVRRTTPHLARRLAEAIDQEQFARSMQQERKRIGLVGESLAEIARLAPAVASRITDRLDWRALFAAVTERPLWNYVHLMAGFLQTLGRQEGQQLVEYLRNTPALARALHDSFREQDNLNGLAHAISALAAARLPDDDILSLFGFSQTSGALAALIGRITATKRFLDHSDDEIANFLFSLSQLEGGYGYVALTRYLALVTQAEPHRLRARRFDLSGFGSLLQIAAAIDGQLAAQLLECRPFRDYGATADGNLGRHAIFILGLNSVSRSAALRFFESVYTPEVCESLIDLTQNMHELINFLHAVEIVSISACRRIVSSLMNRGRDDLEDYLRSEVNLMETSQWAKTLLATADMPAEQITTLLALLDDCSSLDTRLWSLVEGFEAMIEAGAIDAARASAPILFEQLPQVNRLGGLSRCIQIWLKIEHISRVISRPSLLERLAEELLPRALDLLPLEKHKGCAAFAIMMWLSNQDAISESHRAALATHRSRLLAEVRLTEEVTPYLMLIAALLNPSRDEFRATLAKFDSMAVPDWLIGLLAIVARISTPGGESLAGARAVAVDTHQNNLKFGLTVYARRLCEATARRPVGAEPILDERLIEELRLRQVDERSAAVRTLLAPDFDPGTLRARPYSLWVYLRRTVLAPTYMRWESDVAAASEAKIFNQRFYRPVSSVIEAAE